MPVPDGFIATIHLDAVISGFNVNFIRWQVHEDWVGQVLTAIFIHLFIVPCVGLYLYCTLLQIALSFFSFFLPLNYKKGVSFVTFFFYSSSLDLPSGLCPGSLVFLELFPWWLWNEA